MEMQNRSRSIWSITHHHRYLASNYRQVFEFKGIYVLGNIANYRYNVKLDACLGLLTNFVHERVASFCFSPLLQSAYAGYNSEVLLMGECKP